MVHWEEQRDAQLAEEYAKEEEEAMSYDQRSAPVISALKIRGPGACLQ